MLLHRKAAASTASASSTRFVPVKAKLEPEEAILDTIDERNKGLVDAWTSLLVNYDNSFTPIEELVQSTFNNDLFIGEDLNSTRDHVLSTLAKNWEVFFTHTYSEGTQVVRLKKGIYLEARKMPAADPDAPILAYGNTPGIALAPTGHIEYDNHYHDSNRAEMNRPIPASQHIVPDSALPESVESTSAKLAQEAAPKPALLDERKITPEHFLAGGA